LVNPNFIFFEKKNCCFFKDAKAKARLMEDMLKTMDGLSPEERQKALSAMLDNSEDLNPEMKTKLMDEMMKNINKLPTREREKFLASLY